MTSMFKTFAVLGVLAGTALIAQPARADRVSVGFGISVAPTYRTYAPPVYYQPAYVPQVTTYYAPAYSYPPGYYGQTYCPPPVVYAPPVYYPAPTYYAAPVYSSPAYYSSPSFSFGLGFFGFGGGHGGDWGGGHRGGYGGGGHGGGGGHR